MPLKHMKEIAKGDVDKDFGSKSLYKKDKNCLFVKKKFFHYTIFICLENFCFRSVVYIGEICKLRRKLLVNPFIYFAIFYRHIFIKNKNIVLPKSFFWKDVFA